MGSSGKYQKSYDEVKIGQEYDRCRLNSLHGIQNTHLGKHKHVEFVDFNMLDNKTDRLEIMEKMYTRANIRQNKSNRPYKPHVHRDRSINRRNSGSYGRDRGNYKDLLTEEGEKNSPIRGNCPRRQNYRQRNHGDHRRYEGRQERTRDRGDHKMQRYRSKFRFPQRSPVWLLSHQAETEIYFTGRDNLDTLNKTTDEKSSSGREITFLWGIIEWWIRVSSHPSQWWSL